MPRSVKRLAFFLAIGVAGILVLGLAVEITLSFFPVSEDLGARPVNILNPVVRFTPNRDRVRSLCPDFEQVNTVHVNNEGFVSKIDYERFDPRPLIAVIGDNHVEGLMVPFPENGWARLATFMNPKGVRVYGFSASGNALSGYLEYARFAARNFSPAKMIFVIVDNDFDQSLCAFHHAHGFACFQPDALGTLNLQRLDYEPDVWGKVAGRSRLAMYLIANCRMGSAWCEIKDRLFGIETEDPTSSSRIPAKDRRIADSQKAVEAFFRLLPEYSWLEPKDVLFVVDGLRPALYEPETLPKAETGYFGRMRKFFLEKAEGLGYPTVDLQNAFIEDFHQHGQRFENEKSLSWNADGQRVFYEAVLKTGFGQDLYHAQSQARYPGP